MSRCKKQGLFYSQWRTCWKNALNGQDYCRWHTPGYQSPKEKLEVENEKLSDALRRIDTWAKAYPLDIFEKPDLKKAAQVLNAADMTLDAISADAMRHVLDGIKDIVSEALKE